MVAVRGAVPPSCWLVCASHTILPITKSFFNFFQNLKFDWIKLDRDLFKYRIRCLGPKCAKSYEYPPRTSKPSSGRFFTVADPSTHTTLHPLKSGNRAHDHTPSIETFHQQEISIWNDSQGNLDPHAPPLKNETTPDGLLRNENSFWKHAVLPTNTVNDRNGIIKFTRSPSKERAYSDQWSSRGSNPH